MRPPNLIELWLVTLMCVGALLVGTAIGAAVVDERYRQSPSWKCDAPAPLSKGSYRLAHVPYAHHETRRE